jgi:hypothetical protein
MIDELKKEYEKNPLGTIGVCALAVTAVAKLIDVLTAAQGRRAYAKQINHKIKLKNK